MLHACLQLLDLLQVFGILSSQFSLLCFQFPSQIAVEKLFFEALYRIYVKKRQASDKENEYTASGGGEKDGKVCPLNFHFRLRFSFFLLSSLLRSLCFL